MAGTPKEGLSCLLPAKSSLRISRSTSSDEHKEDEDPHKDHHASSSRHVDVSTDLFCLDSLGPAHSTIESTNASNQNMEYTRATPET